MRMSERVVVKKILEAESADELNANESESTASNVFETYITTVSKIGKETAPAKKVGRVVLPEPLGRFRSSRVRNIDALGMESILNSMGHGPTQSTQHRNLIVGNVHDVCGVCIAQLKFT
uniref:Uncharacterized LOC100184634 n=1 Tax=Ciona intestinalis TaxID=7719 RepID=H2Y3D1_CIOIN|nr:uncharacterized protein LOC100184634 [Ciona intestinalis]|eukprot:XP_026694128.1 uncharacterized protein LOC100184634 [Ciona intestinalis]